MWSLGCILGEMLLGEYNQQYSFIMLCLLLIVNERQQWNIGSQISLSIQIHPIVKALFFVLQESHSSQAHQL